MHIEGSPFYVKVVDPQRPECVVVHGLGFQDGVIGKRNFVVETAAAGAEMLTMKVCRTLEDIKERFPLQISRNEHNRRTLRAMYIATTQPSQENRGPMGRYQCPGKSLQGSSTHS